MKQLALAVRLRARARLDNFLVGPNEAPVAAVRELAGGRPGIALLSGPVSSGKSHLLLGAVAAAEQAGRRALYFSLRELLGGNAAMLSGNPGAALVCCDDVDAVAGDATICQELFALWRHSEERGGSLLFAARQVPNLGDWALPDLGSRMRGAATRLTLQPLAESEQRTLLVQRAREFGLDMPLEVLEFLLRRLERDLASQCAFIDELDRAALAAQRRLTVPFVREVLARHSAPG